MSTTRERVEEFLNDVVPRLEALKEEALAEIEEVREKANADERRYRQAVEELESVEAEISALSAEREGLPDRAYRAGMEEDYELEDSLKERYQQLRPAIEALEDRRASLKGELQRLLPNPRGHRYDLMIHYTAREAKVAYHEREALEHLQRRLTEALKATVEPVAKLHNDTRGLVETRSKERSWDEASAARMGVG